MAEEPYDDLDIGYIEYPMPNTEEFTVVRLLTKTGLAQLWQKIKDKFVRIPTDGTDGQAIVKTQSGFGWSDLFNLPSGGTTGQALIKTDEGVTWGDVETDAPEIPTLPNMEGILPISKGGTGCTTIDGLRTLLFNFPTDEEVEEYLNSNT